MKLRSILKPILLGDDEFLTWRVAFFYMTGVAHLLSGVLFYSGRLPDVVTWFISIFFIIFIAGYPFVFHQDRVYLEQKTGWRPTKWFFLGMVPGGIGFFFILYYIFKRVFMTLQYNPTDASDEDDDREPDESANVRRPV